MLRPNARRHPRTTVLHRATAEHSASRAISLCVTFMLLMILPCDCIESRNKTRVTREDYYQHEKDIPNRCSITYNHTSSSNASTQANGSSIVPFIGTALVRDAQLLLLRLYYSIDYPVKYFIVVVSERAWDMSLGGLAYQLNHLKEYGQGVVVITCQQSPSVSEGWNAIIEAFPEEPWGMLVARDTAFTPGALAKMAKHMTKAVHDGSVDVALTNWTMPMEQGEYNAFAVTRSAMNRFGLFDENIYPAFYEDIDFQIRQRRMDPPLKVKTFYDVYMLHGKQSDGKYITGQDTPVDPLNTVAAQHAAQHQGRKHISGNYLFRKWGCIWDGPCGDCSYNTPFNKALPVWYWEHNKFQRKIDKGLLVGPANGSWAVSEAKGKVLFHMPYRFTPEGGWQGYKESPSLSTCRVTGRLGIVRNTSSGLICI